MLRQLLRAVFVYNKCIGPQTEWRKRMLAMSWYWYLRYKMLFYMSQLNLPHNALTFKRWDRETDRPLLYAFCCGRGLHA